MAANPKIVNAEVVNGHLTECGLPGINRIPYGLHACHFFPGRAELVEALVPYFVAGLRAGERCIWIAAPPLPADEAERELRAAWEGAGEAIARGALRILDFDRWYAGTAGLKGPEVVKLWLDEEEHALAQGYTGLRITGNTSFVGPEDWAGFMEYERIAGAGFQGRRIVALCSYLLPNIGSDKVMEVMRAHDCAFDRPDSGWQVLATREL
jgi:two-component system, sensor histidine kinase PdtaS